MLIRFPAATRFLRAKIMGGTTQPYQTPVGSGPLNRYDRVTRVTRGSRPYEDIFFF